nr:hypothetical protein BaRGS_019882 [Batillaria attramentaria]
MSDTLTFTVQELECNLPSVSPVGTASRTVLRSQSVQFDVYINNRGCTKYLALHTWRVFDIPDCTHSLPSSSLNLNAVDMAKPTLILPASSLPASKSQFCVRYTMGYQNTPVAEEVMYNLTALASPLKAIIAGGNQRMVDGTLGSHTLDASFSYNPDNPDTVPVGMNYSWECHLLQQHQS